MYMYVCSFIYIFYMQARRGLSLLFTILTINHQLCHHKMLCLSSLKSSFCFMHNFSLMFISSVSLPHLRCSYYIFIKEITHRNSSQLSKSTFILSFISCILYYFWSIIYNLLTSIDQLYFEQHISIFLC